MRVLLITVGSRGDAEPFVSLAQALSNAGHDVDLWLQEDQQHLAPTSPKISLHILPFKTLDFYKYAGNPKPEHDHPNPRVKFTGVVCDICAELVLPCWREVLDSCSTGENKPNVIVASSLARHLSMALATKMSIPLCLVQLQPLVPTRDFPHSSNTDQCVNALVYGKGANKDENLETYLELERFQYKFMKEKWEQVYSEMKIPFPTVDDMLSILQGKNKDSVMVNACSAQLIPDCSDHLDDNVWNVGPLADNYLPANYKPPQALVDFLNASEHKPVCIGYGSMPFEKTEIICGALKQANERGVLVGSAMMNVDTDDTVFTIESVPYSYLLSRCSMMLSHGGAGVVNATLRAGIPSVISPLMGDQFLWSQLLQAKGLGIVAGSLTEVTMDMLVESIEKAKEFTDVCAKVGKAIHEEEAGSNRMVKLLEAKVGS